MSIDSLTTKTVRSSAWIYGRMLITNLVNLGAMAIIARQLTPAEFGLVALSQVLLRFIAIIGAGGVTEFVIFDKNEGCEERVQAAFWLNMALSLLVMVVGLIAIPWITRFYEVPGLGAILVAFLIRYVLLQLSTVPDALLKKTLDYQKLVIRDTVLEILTSLAMVSLALAGFGAWSIVLPGVAAAPLRSLFVFWMAHWRPRLPLRLPLWQTILRYSTNVIGANLATTITAEGDTLIIMKTLGSTELGLYNLAWQSAMLISRSITGAIKTLMMPALSAVAEDLVRLRVALNRMVRTLGIICFPLIVGLFVIADLFILTIYGPQWKASILPLRILLLFALRHVVSSPINSIFNAIGRPEIGLRFGLGFAPFYLVSIVVGSRFGIIGVAVGVTLARFTGGFISFWLATNLIEEPLLDILGELMRPLSAALLMGGGIFLTRLILNPLQLMNLIELIIMISIGGVLYLGLLRGIYRGLLKDLFYILEAFSKTLAIRLRRLIAFM